MISKIYVVAFKRVVTGGTESLHQLVSKLNELGKQAKIYYIDEPGAIVPEKFKKYQVESVDVIEDSSDNWLIVPETRVEFLKKFYQIKKSIWWLSLDFYLKKYPIYRTLEVCRRKSIPKIFFPIVWIFLLVTKRFNFEHLRINQMENNILHLYNCEYVHEYLKEHRIDEKMMIYLCGPISDDYFENSAEQMERENIILYNPAKNFKFTERVIRALKKNRDDIEIYPIKNMTSEEIINLMKKSKVYMDFGIFPGPERIPREAVVLGCNIITSRNGSAANKKDVLIDDKYKFKAVKGNIRNIVNMISDLMEQYEKHYPEYEDYRKKVIDQKKLFDENVSLIVQRMEKM